jgi:hypothetical protein
MIFPTLLKSLFACPQGLTWLQRLSPLFVVILPFPGDSVGWRIRRTFKKLRRRRADHSRQLGSTESSSRRVEGVIELGYALASSTLTLLLGSPRFRERTDLSVNANRQDGQH